MVRDGIVECLRRKMDMFAWSPSNMSSIDLYIIIDLLNVDQKIKHIQQNKRKSLGKK